MSKKVTVRIYGVSDLAWPNRKPQVESCTAEVTAKRYLVTERLAAFGFVLQIDRTEKYPRAFESREEAIAAFHSRVERDLTDHLRKAAALQAKLDAEFAKDVEYP